MSAPDYNDPESKLRLRLRPMRGAETRLKGASIGSGIGACLCLLAFIASFIPGIESSGSPLWCLFGAAVFAAGSGVFYLAGKLARRLR